MFFPTLKTVNLKAPLFVCSIYSDWDSWSENISVYLHLVWQPLLEGSLEPVRLLCPWDFPGKIIGVRCRFLLQEVFLTWGSNMHLLLWQGGSLPLEATWETKGKAFNYKLSALLTCSYPLYKI